jgi:predicted RecB family nuclease
MKITVSDLYADYRPSKCGLRVFLKQQGVKEAPPSPYEQVIERMGIEHEKRHLATFPSVIDLSSGAPEERLRRTKQEVQKKAQVIYHGLFKADAVIGGVDCEIFGEPDFLIAQGDRAFTIRDSKISRRINEQDHSEIILQMELYGWLYEQTFGMPPTRLQVHSGTGDIIDIAYDGGSAALQNLQEILNYKKMAVVPYSPVGWSKCNGCGFYNYCWPQAETKKDVALVFGVDQGLAYALREQGIETIEQLLVSFTEEKLADFSRPWGKKRRRVGTDAAIILRMARAMASGEEIVIHTPAIQNYTNYAMFDLEGLPPQLDETEKIYLWGMQVFGDKPGIYVAAMAGFGTNGDLQGWEDFLKKANDIFIDYGDIPFVHWHHYERVHLVKYIERFGDRGGIAARVKENLLDLLPISQKSIALPLPSYSLKVIEKYIGFKRTQDEYGGDWAMAKYIEAMEMEDEKQRAEVMDKILTYNKEDLEATWAVLQWLKSKKT